MNTIDFQPPWWLRNKHIQSIYANLFPRQSEVLLQWEEVPLSDGDFLDLAWAGRGDGPLVILLHGLEGSVFSHYIQEMLMTVLGFGWQAVTLHYRSCSGRMNRFAKSYNGGNTEDFAEVIALIKKRHPFLPLFALGFSLGGNILLRYLADQGQSCPLLAGIAVSMPYELAKSADYLVPFYQHVLLRSLKQKVIEKVANGIKMPVAVEELPNIQRLRRFDALVTAPLYGYDSVDDYYQDMSSRTLLKKVVTPSLILHALDDPFVPENSLPRASELSSSITFEVSEYGGHMGFIKGGLPWKPSYWMTERIWRFFQASLR